MSSVPTVCPKCARERSAGADACAGCGLLVSRWSGWAPDLGGEPRLTPLWAEIEESWEDDARHARFLDAAAGWSALDLAAAHYRDALRRRPGDTRAQAGIDRAVRLALQLQEVAGREPALGAGARWLKLFGVAVAAVLLLATMWVLVSTLRR
jgi:hypothetical protein